MRVTTASIAALALAVVACKHRDDEREQAKVVVTSATCLRCDAPVARGALIDHAMDETSGLVASSTKDGVYFAHNDSGDVARVFAIDESGARLATYRFSRDEVLDCEDIARGPCDASGGACLFVGDIGDNGRSRDGITVYRMHEPTAFADATIPSDAIRLLYPDGAHDAETLLVHPKTGVITILSKERDGASSIYQAAPPFSLTEKVKLKAVGTVTAPAGSKRFTGGDVKADGTGIVLRTYTHVFFAPMHPDQAIADALKEPLCSLPVAQEPQGEAIAWRRDGAGFLTVSEGVGAKINATSCGAPP